MKNTLLMQQSFFDLILAWPTVFYTVLLGLIVFYWLFMAFGLLGADSIEPDLDLDLDTDIDVDLDLDTDIEIDADLEGDAGELADTMKGGRRGPWYPFKTLLVWLNVGRVPLLFLISIFAVFAWGISAFFSREALLGNTLNFIVAGGIGILLAALLTKPFIPLFARMSQEAKDVDYIGTSGKMLLPASHDKFGQMEVRHADDYLLVHVKPAPGSTDLPAGSRVVIIGRTPDQRFYLAEPESF